MRHIRRVLYPAGLALLLGGCWGGAYVYDPIKFNRDAQGFGRPVTDIKSVTICYSRLTATSGEVVSLAEAECAKFNKLARLQRQDRTTCPMAAPIAARYRCMKSFSTTMPQAFPMAAPWGIGRR